MAGKPDDIPQDVWDVASKVVTDADYIFDGRFDGGYTPTPEAIARAILAERERCARVVEDYEPDMKPWDGPTERANARSATDYACIDLAAAIRGLPNG